jgi:hypothetical protein
MQNAGKGIVGCSVEEEKRQILLPEAQFGARREVLSQWRLHNLRGCGKNFLSSRGKQRG